MTYISWASNFVISWRLFDELMLSWRYWFSVTQTLNWNYICRPVTYISWSSNFALYLEDYLTNVIVGILNPCDAKINHIKHVGQWPTFLGPVILTCILKSFDEGLLDWRYWFSVTLSLTYKYICRSVTYISWCSESSIYFQYYLMNKPHSLDIGSTKGHWLVFHD